MRLLPLLAALATAAAAMTACTSETKDPTGIEWHLRAIDGTDVEMPATLTVDATGTISGRAPCNRYTGQNQAKLPEMKVPAFASTKMACDRLDDEQVFFAALSAMTRLEARADGTLVLTGPDGRSMTFARGG